MRGSMTNRRD